MSIDLSPTVASRWEYETYLQVYCAALPLIESGLGVEDAINEVQRLWLRPERQRADVDNVVKSKLMGRVREEVRRLSPESRLEQAARLKREHRLWEETSQPNRPPIHWRDLDWALLYRRVKYHQRDLGDPRSVQVLACEAQMVELKPHRWRPRTALMNVYGIKNDQGVPAQFARIAPLADELLKAIPFNPRQTAAPDEPEPREEPPVERQEPVHQEPVRQEPVRQEEPAPRSLRDLIQGAGGVLQVSPQAQEPAEAPKATLPFSGLEKAPGDPFDGFARHLVGAMRSLFDAMATHSAASLETSVRRISEQLHESSMAALDERIHAMSRAHVSAALESALGGPVEVPEVVMEPLKVDLQGAGLDQRLRIDVVGLFPKQITEVRKALNGFADTVRFTPPDQLDRWEPKASIVIGNLKVMNRSIEERCRKAHVEVHRVWGASSAVLKAIQEVYAQTGIELPLH